MNALNVDDFYVRVGCSVKQHRKAMRMSQQTLSDLVGLSRPSVANIETGRQRIYLDTAMRLSEIFDVSLDKIWSESPNPVLIKRPEPIPTCDRCTAIAKIFQERPTPIEGEET